MPATNPSIPVDLAPRYVSLPPAPSLLERATVINIPNSGDTALVYNTVSGYYESGLPIPIPEPRRWRYYWLEFFWTGVIYSLGGGFDPQQSVSPPAYYAAYTPFCLRGGPFFGWTHIQCFPLRPNSAPSPPIGLTTTDNGNYAILYLSTIPYRSLMND